MEPLRRQAIADYITQLHAGLDDLISRCEMTRAAYEAELASMNNEIERYRQLIADAERESQQEAELSRGGHAKDHYARRKLNAPSSEASDSRSVKPGTQVAKSEHLRAAALRILRAQGHPIKRPELTRQLQATGLLAKSDNPIDLVRKLLQKSNEIGYDVKTGYFLVDEDH